LYTVLKAETVHNFYTFMLITLLLGTTVFYTFFNRFEIDIKFGIFLYPYHNVVKKYFWGHISTFYQL
jgi:hypothetical protein